MMGFTTKRELLEHIGKNPNDNKLVDRMMRRGEVYMEDGMYYIVESEEVVKLKEEIKELKKSDLRGELEEAKVQWEYWERQTRRYVDYLEKVISVTYDRVKPLLGNKIEEKSEFREHILEEVKALSKYKEE